MEKDSGAEIIVICRLSFLNEANIKASIKTIPKAKTE